ncbi:Acg family FMN-binding oxidoreductase [Glaciecola petra]|uniref:Twin-arginine translocation pathway signal protein n=1 Tax=Glaciecola petra TaxID=3075602 RepID=A0ABU2ZTT0_9ALTE|nr:nitroreductase family protein [Aestuariibacter sp. P117]MDT0596041.1 hypothetical protein [Aestuariibacter sp. P117]
MQRRKFLKVLGSSAVIASPLMLGCTSSGGLVDPAKPWTDAGQGNSPIIQALSWALLAPNPHNRQPWQVALHGERSATLYADPNRKLPITDPFERQITIGLGAFVELLRLAAANHKELLSIEWFPDGTSTSGLNNRPVAHLSLKPNSTSPNALFTAVSKRRTTRGKYNSTPVEQSLINDLVNSIGHCKGLRWGTTTTSNRVLELNSLAKRAYEREIDTDAAYLESAKLMRIGKQEVAANPDGISLTGVFFDWLNLFGLISHKDLRDLKGRSRQTARKTAQELTTARAHIWLLTTGNSRLDQVTAGAHYLRLNLVASQMGLAIQPLSQALQEYPEMTQEYAEARKLLGAENDEKVQMWARLGYSDITPPSPRWALSTRII